MSATFLPTEPTETPENYAGQKIKCVGKHFPWPLDLHASLELGGHGTVIHGKQQNRNLSAGNDKAERQARKQEHKTKISRKRSKA